MVRRTMPRVLSREILDVRITDPFKCKILNSSNKYILKCLILRREPIGLSSVDNCRSLLNILRKITIIILLVLLDFVGGKNIFIPSEKAKKKEARNICSSKGLELMSLESLTQLDAVQDFVSDLGWKHLY